MAEKTLAICTDPMDKPDPLVSALQCSARNRQGKQCGKPPIQGGTVCRMHGGGAPQVRQAAELRILKMVTPALAELRKLIEKADSDAVRMRAIKDVLDRAGFAPAMKMEHAGKDGESLFGAAAIRAYMKAAPEDGE